MSRRKIAYAMTFKRKKLQSQLVYDGQCPFCVNGVRRLKAVDVCGVLKLADIHSCGDIRSLHPDLTKESAMRQLHLIEPDGTLYGGFKVFRRLCLTMPALYLLIPLLYCPGMGVIGPFVSRITEEKHS
jgi:predicted DCC family thiol-disulfide oxidoreductase YuxK